MINSNLEQIYNHGQTGDNNPLTNGMNEAFSGLKLQTSDNGSSSSLESGSHHPISQNITSSCNLQKSYSVPHLTNTNNGISAPGNLLAGLQKQGSFKQRKKTTEANAIPESLLHSQLIQENKDLQEQLKRGEEVHQKLMRVNQCWDIDYNALKQKVATMENDMTAVREELVNRDKEISTRDKEIQRLKKKLEDWINKECEKDSDKSSWQQLDCDEDEQRTSCKDDQSEGGMSRQMSFDGSDTYDRKNDMLYDRMNEMQELVNENKVLNQRIYQHQERYRQLEQHIQQQNQQQNSQKERLHREIQRLSTAIEMKHSQLEKCDKHLSTTSLSPSSIDAIDAAGNKLPDIELLHQQLQLYKDDFNAEKEEKQKLLNENADLKKQLAEEKGHCIKQLESYERDFQEERNKRIQLMRIVNKTEIQQQHQQQINPMEKEYAALQSERDRINGRMNELQHGMSHCNSGGRNNPLHQSSRFQNQQLPNHHPPSGYQPASITYSHQSAPSSSHTYSTPYSPSYVGSLPPHSPRENGGGFSNGGSPHTGLIRDSEKHWMASPDYKATSPGRHKAPSEMSYR